MNVHDLKLRSRLFPNTGSLKKIDTVNLEKPYRRANDVLMDSFAAWQGLDKFRREADLNKMYTFGDQWGERVPWKGKFISEREAIKRQGNIPITNNRIRNMVRSISGVFQQNQTEPVCVARERDGQIKGEILTSTLQYVYQLNKMWSLDVATLNNLIISGLAMFKSEFGWRHGKMDIWTDALNYSRVFFDSRMEDTRQWDCSLIGELEDMSLYDVMARFSDGSRENAERIRSIYANVNHERIASYVDAYTKDTRHYRDFFISDDDTQCRVITTWRKEARERLLVHDKLHGEYYKVEVSEEDFIIEENERRISEQSIAGISVENMKLLEYNWMVDNYWYYYHQAPSGEILKEGETPYWHESHPYSFKLHTFYDKEIHPFVSGFRDQQRYINRLISMQDFIMRASAKGVLMIPEQCLEGTGKTPEQFAEDWVKFNGVITYTAKPGIPLPQQITSNSTALGIYDMLSMQLKMLDDISGVQSALQGQAPAPGTPASLYAQQVQNASTSLSEMFDIYKMLREERDIKNVKLIQQYYTEVRYINVSGEAKGATVYDPDQVRNTEVDLSIVESTSTPVFRSVVNDMLLNLLNTGHITMKDMLEHGSFPFADKMLQSLSAREEVAEGQMPPIASKEMLSEVSGNTNPEVMNMYNQMMS